MPTSSAHPYTAWWAARLLGFFLRRYYVRNIVDLVVYRALASEWSSKRGLIQVLVQDYGGRPCDVTLTPWRHHLSLPQALMTVIKNPTREEIKDLILVSRMSIWPQVAKIEAHCRVEMTLDK
jgi:TAG lipase / steryl ester hydrolase / phospholipase A2 / LPA acyltransferase